MNPDEERLALWLDDELPGEERAAFEAGLPADRFAEREGVRRMKALMAAGLPASEEPPYAEFFNSRIMAEIRKPALPAPARPAQPWWMPVRRFLVPAGICAGMAAAFVLGTRSRTGGGVHVAEVDVSNAPRAIPVENFVYTPDRSVEAEWFDSRPASAVVLVLNGVDAIPDQVDLLETAALPGANDWDAVASGGEGAR